MSICPICQSESTKRFPLGPYLIKRCSNCGFGWPDPLPTELELSAFYADCHHPHAVKDDPVLPAKRLRVAKELRTLAPEASDFLDVGCGFGQQLDVAAELGFRTCGVEIDKDRAQVARGKGHDVRSSISEHDPASCDVIVMDQVIEHLVDPMAMLREVKTRLRPKGLLYIGCPNFGSLRARISGAQFGELAPPEHIAYFTKESLSFAMNVMGFERILCRTRTIPVNVKNLLAHICKLRFLKKPNYIHPKDNVPGSIPRFVDGKLRLLKVPLYGIIMAASWLLCPVVNALGGEQIESFWRKQTD